MLFSLKQFGMPTVVGIINNLYTHIFWNESDNYTDINIIIFNHYYITVYEM